MATAISNLFSFRTRHERVPTEEESGVSTQTSDEEVALSVEDPPANNNNNRSNSSDNLVEEDDIVVETVDFDDEETGEISAAASENENETAEDDDAAQLTATIPRLSSRGTVTLSELEEERELARRRTSACVLLAVFVLFRLWVEALQNGDLFVMMLCLFGTSWTARLIRHNREREEALDERIRAYLENADTANVTEIDRNDLRFLSFQAQLALAMMESQRQMQNGGYGHPDGHTGSEGVSEGAKKQWEHFSYKEGLEGDPVLANQGGYGSVAQNEHAKGLEEDGPHCSICLGEYEDGEKLVKLPCNHIYHGDCLESWTSNHTRCPLCNTDLESVTSDAAPEENMV